MNPSVNEFLLDGWKSDFSIFIEDKEFKLHKDILMMRSDYFKTLFLFSKDIANDRFEEDHIITKELFQVFVNYWYSIDKPRTIPALYRNQYVQQMREVHNFLLCTSNYLPDTKFSNVYIPKTSIVFIKKTNYISTSYKEKIYYVPEKDFYIHNLKGGTQKAKADFIKMINEHIKEETGFDAGIYSFLLIRANSEKNPYDDAEDCIIINNQYRGTKLKEAIENHLLNYLSK